MNLDLVSGTYVLAVSGGVDSVVLLDLLTKQKNIWLIVAHFDHGIREDSQADREFVADLAEKYGLVFEYGEGNLGKGASEEAARSARYDFLRGVQKKHKAKAIITAHHQDDVIETMFINLIRGTKQKGLVSLTSSSDIERPLLNMSKQDIKDYARQHNLHWREDSTNTDESYMRNWLRINIVPKLSLVQRKKLLALYENTKQSSKEIEKLLDEIGAESNALDKKVVTSLPHDVALEYIAHWFRANNFRDFDKKTLERAVLGIKTLHNSKNVELKKGFKIEIGDKCVKLVKTT